jgi:hypothetical protein
MALSDRLQEIIAVFHAIALNSVSIASWMPSRIAAAVRASADNVGAKTVPHLSASSSPLRYAVLCCAALQCGRSLTVRTSAEEPPCASLPTEPQASAVYCGRDRKRNSQLDYGCTRLKRPKVAA